jgi:hypothetical protein
MWIEKTSLAAWSPRYLHSAVVLPDNTLLIMGGGGPASYFKNDVWASTDQGKTWSQQTGSAEWAGRNSQACVTLSDGSVLIMGGTLSALGTKTNDVWHSLDQGKTWHQHVQKPSWWTPRGGLTCVVLSDDVIILAGGQLNGGTYFNDCWMSADSGETWTQQTASGGWIPRFGHTLVKLSDDRLILAGGFPAGGAYLNDVWTSTDQGKTWSQQTGSAEWTGRYRHSSVVSLSDTIFVIGGNAYAYSNEVWKSSDLGVSWFLDPTTSFWTGRYGHASVISGTDGIFLMGGYTSAGEVSDVWCNDTAIIYYPIWSIPIGRLP